MTVGYVYDPIYLEHETSASPETGARLTAIMGHLTSEGLLARMHSLPFERASEEEVLAVHSADLLESIRRVCARGGGPLDRDTDASPRSYDVALHAVGGALAATRGVLGGQVESAFALLRPPGHHANRDRARGFCLLNNVAAAATWALNEGHLSRLAIVDFDAHHGNGTQDILDAEPRALFVSTHQYPFYPGTGHWRDKGCGAAEGNTLNIPLPALAGDSAFARAYDLLVEPALRRFQPEVILVSAGYDAHWADRTGLQLSLTGYRRIADRLVSLARELCRGRLVACLEGGYSLHSLPLGVAVTLRAMLGLPHTDTIGPAPEPEPPIEGLLRTIARYHGLSEEG